MRDFFGLDGPFNRYGGMVADMIILSLMWLLFSIPLITIGASTTAMFYVSTRRIANREGYITRDFWESFKANIKRATIIWIIMLAMGWLIWFNISNIDAVGGIGFIVFPIQFVILAEILIMSVYIFPITARFDMSLKQSLKSSFYMANRHLLTSLSCVVLLAAAVLSFFLMPPLALFLAPGIYAWLSSLMIMRIFKRYRPEMDRDPVLEIQEIEAKKEEERRRRNIGTISDSNRSENDNEPEDFWASFKRDDPNIVETKDDSKEETIPQDTGKINIAAEETTDTESPKSEFIDSIFEDAESAEKKTDIWTRLRNAAADDSLAGQSD